MSDDRLARLLRAFRAGDVSLFPQVLRVMARCGELDGARFTYQLTRFTTPSSTRTVRRRESIRAWHRGLSYALRCPGCSCVVHLGPRQWKWMRDGRKVYRCFRRACGAELVMPLAGDGYWSCDVLDEGAPTTLEDLIAWVCRHDEPAIRTASEVRQDLRDRTERLLREEAERLERQRLTVKVNAAKRSIRSASNQLDTWRERVAAADRALHEEDGIMPDALARRAETSQRREHALEKVGEWSSELHTRQEALLVALADLEAHDAQEAVS